MKFRASAFNMTPLYNLSVLSSVTYFPGAMSYLKVQVEYPNKTQKAIFRAFGFAFLGYCRIIICQSFQCDKNMILYSHMLLKIIFRYIYIDTKQKSAAIWTSRGQVSRTTVTFEDNWKKLLGKTEW